MLPPPIFLDPKQVLIPRHNVVRTGLDSTLQDLIIVRVILDHFKLA